MKWRYFVERRPDGIKLHISEHGNQLAGVETDYDGYMAAWREREGTQSASVQPVEAAGAMVCDDTPAGDYDGQPSASLEASGGRAPWILKPIDGRP